MTFYELYKKLSQLYPESLRCEWDNDGIMCADNLDAEVEKILIALDVTGEVVDYAISNNFDTIVSHHPLVFNSQKSLNSQNYTQAKLIRLVKNGVGVMSFHTRLDAVNGGVNDTLCGLLKLQDIEIDSDEPIGRVAHHYPKMKIDDFAKYVKEKLNSSFVLFSGNKQVHRIYVVGGDGKDLISRAIELGCDTILTGRGSYNTTIDAIDMGLNIIEAGHFFTENPICEKIKKDILSINPKSNIQIYYSNCIKTI